MSRRGRLAVASFILVLGGSLVQACAPAAAPPVATAEPAAQERSVPGGAPLTGAGSQLSPELSPDIAAASGTMAGLSAARPATQPRAIITPSGGPQSIAAVALPAVGRAAAPEPTPRVVPPASTAVITVADAGNTVKLQVGGRLLLDLGTGYVWKVMVADQTILSQVLDAVLAQDAQGLYEAKHAGQTTLTASGDPECSRAQPPCGRPSRIVEIRIVVG